MINQIQKHLERKNVNYLIGPALEHESYVLDTIIVAADWNYPEIQRLGEYIEDHLETIQIAFPDEIFVCSNCGTICEIQQHNFFKSHGEVFCRKCVEENKIPMQDLIEEYTDNPYRAMERWMVHLCQKENLIKKIDQEFEIGMHPGMNDDPHKIMRDFHEKYPHKRYIFGFNEVNPFMTRYSIWEVNK